MSIASFKPVPPNRSAIIIHQPVLCLIAMPFPQRADFNHHLTAVQLGFYPCVLL